MELHDSSKQQTLVVKVIYLRRLTTLRHGGSSESCLEPALSTRPDPVFSLNCHFAAPPWRGLPYRDQTLRRRMEQRSLYCHDCRLPAPDLWAHQGPRM